MLVHRQRDVHKQTLCSSFAELVWAFFVGFDICFDVVCFFLIGWLILVWGVLVGGGFF